MSKEFCPKNLEEWKSWMKENHIKEDNIWLVQNKKSTKEYNLSYNDALETALCYGWIDSTIKPIDDKQYKRYFSKRRKNSVWSNYNKNKINELIERGMMQKAGFEVIERAKADGSYNTLDDANNGIIPEDLQIAFDNNSIAYAEFKLLSNKDRARILRRLTMLKTPPARNRRINNIINDLISIYEQKTK